MGSAGNMSDEERALGPTAWKSMMAQESKVDPPHTTPLVAASPLLPTYRKSIWLRWGGGHGFHDRTRFESLPSSPSHFPLAPVTHQTRRLLCTDGPGTLTPQHMALHWQVIASTDKADARYCGGSMTGNTGWVCW